MDNATSQSELLGYFDTLDTVGAEAMTGLWQGHGQPSGHPFDGVLENLGWFGKRFHASGRADPLLFQSGPGRLVAIDPARIPIGLALRLGSFGRSAMARSLFAYFRRALRASGPTASLQPRAFRGGMTAAMVYDRQPIADYFRRVDERTLLGVMEIRDDPRFFFFTLTRMMPA